MENYKNKSAVGTTESTKKYVDLHVSLKSKKSWTKSVDRCPLT